MATVDNLITDARTFAKDAFEQTKTLVADAESAISQFQTPPVLFGSTVLVQPDLPVIGNVPDFTAPSVDIGPAPEAPTDLTNLPTLDFGAAPVNTAVKPALNMPSLPAQLRTLNIEPPQVTTSFAFPELPGELQQITFAPPTVGDYAAPDKPELQLPAFEAVRPEQDITAPTDYEQTFAKNYRDIAPTMMAALDGQMDTLIGRYNPQFKNQMAALEAKLAKFIEGGTALSPAVENAIFERSKSKVNGEFLRAREVAYADAAKRGLTLPDGVLNASVQRARQAGADSNARAAVEIAVKQAELEQQNTQWALTLSNQLRTTVLNAALSYHQNLISINGQAVQYAQAVLNAAIEVYNALVKAFSVRLEAYKADAQVYETRMRAVQVAVEIYRAEIGAMEALVRVDLARVDIYKARLDALNTLSGVYKSQIDAVLGRASLEKLKIELFGAQVQAYGVEAQAKSAEYNGYSALVQGQEARMRVYGEEVRAYTADVDGYKARVSAKTAEVQALIELNKGVLQQYQAKIEGYKALTDTKAKVASLQIDYQKTKLYAFQAKVNADEANARLAQEYYRTKAYLGSENFKAVSQTAIEQARLSATQIEATARTALGGAQVYQGLAGAALSGMNTLVTTSTSGS